MRILEKPLNANLLSETQINVIKKLFAMGNLTPLLHSKQKELALQYSLSSSEDFLILSGRQWGKTHYGLCVAIAYCIKNPGSRVLYYGPTKDKLSDIVNDGMEPIVQWAPEGLIKRMKSAHRWKVGESELRLHILERAHVGRNRGTNAKGLIVIEEGGFIPSEDFQYAFEVIIEAQRLRHKPKLFVITSPSEDELHYIHKTLLPRLQALNSVARYSIYDNPFLTDEDIAKVEAKVTKETWTREYLAQIVRSEESLVIPEFQPKHVVQLSPPPYANWILGLDLGGELDQHGITLSYYDYDRKKFCVYKEAMLPVNTTLDEIIAVAKDLEKFKTQGPFFRVVDCGGQPSIEFGNKGFFHIKPEKPAGSFKMRINALRIALQSDEIEFDQGCSETIAQVGYGKYNKQRDDFARVNGHHHDLLASLLYQFQHRNTANPYPAHTYGHTHSHHMANAPVAQSIEQAFSNLHSRFQV